MKNLQQNMFFVYSTKSKTDDFIHQVVNLLASIKLSRNNINKKAELAKNLISRLEILVL